METNFMTIEEAERFVIEKLMTTKQLTNPDLDGSIHRWIMWKARIVRDKVNKTLEAESVNKNKEFCMALEYKKGLIDGNQL